MFRTLVLALLLTAGLLVPAGAARAVGSTFVVTTTADTADGACDADCSLREAITAANAAPGPDTIAFSIPAASDAGCSQSTGVCSIEPLSTLPEIIDPVTIDGYTQPGASINTDAAASNAALKIELDGSSSILSVGLDVAAGDTTVRGLVVNGSAYVFFYGAGNNVVEGNFIGTDAAGEAGLSGGGLFVGAGASETRVGGVTPSARNVISGNSWGIALDSVQDVTVQGNLIGTNAAGTAAIPNLRGGVLIYSGSSNTIGGNTPAARNVISGNGTGAACCPGGPGVKVDGVDAAGNLISGNYIGLDVSGTAALGNAGAGIELGVDGVQTEVGGDVPGAGNAISANGWYGVVIGGTINPNANNVVRGNIIGTDVSGTSDFGNAHGGVLVANSGNIIGGTTGNSRNVLSGNDGPGVACSDMGI